MKSPSTRTSTRTSLRQVRRKDDCEITERCDRVHPGSCGMAVGLRGRDFSFLLRAWRPCPEPRRGDTEESLLRRIGGARRTNYHIMRAFVLHAGRVSKDTTIKCKDGRYCRHSPSDIVKMYEKNRGSKKYLWDDQMARIRYVTQVEKAMPRRK